MHCDSRKSISFQDISHQTSISHQLLCTVHEIMNIKYMYNQEMGEMGFAVVNVTQWRQGEHVGDVR